jgi:hypothetical protein
VMEVVKAVGEEGRRRAGKGNDIEKGNEKEEGLVGFDSSMGEFFRN